MKRPGRKAKIYIASFVGVVAMALLAGIAYAAFSDKGQVLGSSFSVGSTDIKLLINLAQGSDSANLADQLPGPAFTNIIPNWQDTYLIKVFNNGTTSVTLTSNANYETANDPDELRSVIYVAPAEWNDANNNGVADSGEEGTSFGKKTITKWKTEGYNLGQIVSGGVKGYILHFSTESLSDTKQGKNGAFDFEFDSANL